MAHMYFIAYGSKRVQIQLRLCEERGESSTEKLLDSAILRRRERETVIQWRFTEIILHPSPNLKDPPMEIIDIACA